MVDPHVATASCHHYTTCSGCLARGYDIASLILIYASDLHAYFRLSFTTSLVGVQQLN